MNLLKKNVGKLDRIMRVVFGTGFILAGLVYFFPPLSYLFLLLGAIWLLTGILGACPAYSLIGINTCSGVCNLQGKEGEKVKESPKPRVSPLKKRKPIKRKSKKK